MIKVAPKDLLIGDILASDESVWVTGVTVDSDGTWVEFSDGDAGYYDSRLRVIRFAQ